MAEKLKGAPSKGEGGSWLYGIFLMAAGGLIIVLGVLDILGINSLAIFLEAALGPDVAAMLPTVGVTNFVVGIFAIIGGYGLIIDQEWGWGISMFILVYTIAQSIVYVVNELNSLAWSPTQIVSSAVVWIGFITIGIAGVGIVYLAVTKYKYA